MHITYLEKRKGKSPHDAPKGRAFTVAVVAIALIAIAADEEDKGATLVLLLRVAAAFIAAAPLLLAAKGDAPPARGASVERILMDRERERKGKRSNSEPELQMNAALCRWPVAIEKE